MKVIVYEPSLFETTPNGFVCPGKSSSSAAWTEQ